VLIVDRLKAIATKKVNDIAQLKKEGERVVDDLMKILLYNEGKFSFLNIYKIF
jgi:hypothetical protein